MRLLVYLGQTKDRSQATLAAVSGAYLKLVRSRHNSTTARERGMASSGTEAPTGAARYASSLAVIDCEHDPSRLVCAFHDELDYIKIP